MSNTVAIVDNPRKRTTKRRTPPRYKSGPKKGQFMPKSARKRSGGSRKRKPAASKKRRTYGPKRKSYIKSGPRKGQRRGNYTMKKARRKSASGKTVTVRKRYYTNPGSSFVLMNPRKRKGKFLEGVLQIGGLSAVAFGGAIATRKVTKLVMREHDAGWKGYLGNGALAVGAGIGLAFLTKMPDVGAAVTIGGGVAMLLRIVNEQTAPDSPLRVGKANYRKRLGKSDHDLRRRKRGNKAYNLAGSYRPRPGNFGAAGYSPARPTRQRAIGSSAFASNFRQQVGTASYVPAY